MDKLLTSLSELAAAAGGRLLLALLVLLLGRLMIRSLLRLLDRSRLLTRRRGPCAPLPGALSRSASIFC